MIGVLIILVPANAFWYLLMLSDHVLKKKLQLYSELKRFCYFLYKSCCLEFQCLNISCIGYKILSHTGSTYGYRAKLTLFPDKDFGVFIAMTGDDPSYLYRSNIHSLISDLYLGEKPWLNATIICSFPEPFRTKSISSRPKIDTTRTPARNSSDYLGVYKNTPYGYVTVMKDNNRLKLNYGLGQFDLYAKTTKDEFYINSVGLSTGMYNFQNLKFIQSSDGTISAVEISAFESSSPPVFTRVSDSPVNSAFSLNICFVSLLPHVLLILISIIVF